MANEQLQCLEVVGEVRSERNWRYDDLCRERLTLQYNLVPMFTDKFPEIMNQSIWVFESS